MDSAKVIAQTSELTDTPVRQRSYEKHEINLNAFPVPMEVDELSGGEALRTSLFNHSAKFHKTCKLKFGKEKLEKVIKRHEKQDNFGTLEKHSTLKGKWKLWFHRLDYVQSLVSSLFLSWWFCCGSTLQKLSDWSNESFSGFPVFQHLWNFND